MHTSTHIPDKRTEASDRMKRARPNRMQKAQVLPPHHVDLTLRPASSMTFMCRPMSPVPTCLRAVPTSKARNEAVLLHFDNN